MTREERANDYAEHNQGKYTNEFGNLYHAYLKGAEEETKSKISFALKDLLQQGLEIICKENEEIEKENAELKDKLEILISVGNLNLSWKCCHKWFE